MVKKGDDKLESTIAYIHGRIEAQIEGFAQSMGITKQLLAARLAELLSPKGLGADDSVPILRSKAAQKHKAMGKMEVVSSTSVGVSKEANVSPGYVRSDATRAKAKRVASSYWSRMTPQQRSYEMRRRAEVKAKNRAAKEREGR